MFAAIPITSGLLFIVTRLIILFGYEPYLSDVQYYFEVARSAWDGGNKAYKDIFYGYPPFSLSTIYLPYFVAKSYDSYRLLYQFTNVVFDAVTFMVTARFLHDRLTLNPKQIQKALCLFVVLGLFHGHYIYDRVDAFIVMCFTIALYFLSAGGAIRAAAVGAAGVLWKVIPVIWLPAVSLAGAAKGRLRGFTIATVAFVMPVAVFIFVYDQWIGGALIKSLMLHSDRGIQIESLWATPLMLWKAFVPGAPISVANNHGAQHLAGVAEIYVQISRYAGFVALGLFYAYCARLIFKRRNDSQIFNGRGYAVFCFFLMSLPILIFLSTQRVLSTTFMIWLIPVLSVFWILLDRKCILAAALIMGVLTYIGFDLGYWKFVAFEPFFVSVYAIRNLILGAVTFFLFREFSRFLASPETVLERTVSIQKSLLKRKQNRAAD